MSVFNHSTCINAIEGSTGVEKIERIRNQRKTMRKKNSNSSWLKPTGACSCMILAQLALSQTSCVSSFQPLVTHSRIPFKIRSFQSTTPIPALRATVEDEDFDNFIPDLFADETLSFSRDDLQKLTVAQLRQQLRLRGGKVGGKKAELIDRLLVEPKANQLGKDTNGIMDPEIVQTAKENAAEKKSKAREFADSRGKKLIDVTEYLEEDEKGKDSKTTADDEDEDETPINEKKKDASPETWGDEAKIVEDYEGRSVVVDGLSRTVVEFKGSKKEKVQAYVVASRDSLRPYMAGGDRGSNSTEMEEAVKNIQAAKERQSKVPMQMEDEQGEDKDDEDGHYTNILDRDYGDWGKYSMTGVQMSAQEVKGVLLLSDVYGPFSDDIQMLADKIAFECQPVVVFAPDMFRGKPWKESKEEPGFNDAGESYEEWRACHPDDRVSIDIRAAAAALREQYGVQSVSLFGLCYGGGRALEATARVYPTGSTDDINEEEGPSHVDPSTCIAWYPTRYDVSSLYGEKRKSINDEKRPSAAVMAIFAGEDDIPGATPEDASKLKECLESDPNVKDQMVKVFGGQAHGFAHMGMGQEVDGEEDQFLTEEFGGMPSRSIDNGDAEVASLLSTAWVETYARQFLPTIGEAVKDDDVWSNISMQDLSNTATRDIRAEMKDALLNHKDVEPDLKRMHPDDFKTPIDDIENMDETLEEALKTQPYGASLEDDADTFLAKLEDALEREDFGFLPGFGEVPLDESVDGKAYW